jgi:hypothetical protein
MAGKTGGIDSKRVVEALEDTGLEVPVFLLAPGDDLAHEQNGLLVDAEDGRVRLFTCVIKELRDQPAADAAAGPGTHAVRRPVSHRDCSRQHRRGEHLIVKSPYPKHTVGGCLGMVAGRSPAYVDVVGRCSALPL